MKAHFTDRKNIVVEAESDPERLLLKELKEFYYKRNSGNFKMKTKQQIKETLLLIEDLLGSNILEEPDFSLWQGTFSALQWVLGTGIALERALIVLRTKIK